MSEDNDTHGLDAGSGEAQHQQDAQPEPGPTEPAAVMEASPEPAVAAATYFDPSEGTPVEQVPDAGAMEATSEAVDYDDRDVRVPRSMDDRLAEPSMEEQIRAMAAEEPPAFTQPPQLEPEQQAAPTNTDSEVTAVLRAHAPAWPADSDQAPAEQEADQDSDEPEERQMEAEAAAEAAKQPPQRVVPRPAMAAAHEAFGSAVRSHARLKGLQLIDQSSYLQILHPDTGHKVYVALAVKTHQVHIETTLPVIGRLSGALEPKKDNGRIMAVMDPSVNDGDELKTVLALIDLLASGEFGKLPPPRRREQQAK